MAHLRVAWATPTRPWRPGGARPDRSPDRSAPAGGSSQGPGALSDPGGAGTRKRSREPHRAPPGEPLRAGPGGGLGDMCRRPAAWRQRPCSTVSSISTTKRCLALGSWLTASSCCWRREAWLVLRTRAHLRVAWATPTRPLRSGSARHLAARSAAIVRAVLEASPTKLWTMAHIPVGRAAPTQPMRQAPPGPPRELRCGGSEIPNYGQWRSYPSPGLRIPTMPPTDSDMMPPVVPG